MSTHMFLWRMGENYPTIITKYSTLTIPLGSHESFLPMDDDQISQGCHVDVQRCWLYNVWQMMNTCVKHALWMHIQVFGCIMSDGWWLNESRMSWIHAWLLAAWCQMDCDQMCQRCPGDACSGCLMDNAMLIHAQVLFHNVQWMMTKHIRYAMLIHA